MTVFKNAFLILVLMTIFTNTSHAEVSVVVNKSNTTELSESQIKSMFLGKLGQFSDGTEAMPVLFEATEATRIEFDDTVLKRQTSQIDALWSKLIFTGRRAPPVQVKDSTAVLKEVSMNPKAIGYVNSKDVTDSVRVVGTY
jgi:ABC-type phosphate transport system substrate-binding protein